MDLVKREADARQRDRVLTDLRQVEGRAPDLDRFYVGERVAAVVGKKIMLAVIAHAEEITHFAERVASNRGALISVVSPEPVALAWLER